MLPWSGLCAVPFRNLVAIGHLACALSCACCHVQNGRSELRERTISKDGTFEEKAHKFRADLSHRSSRELRERRESAESEADEQPSDLPARPYTDVRYQPGLRGLNTNFRQQVSI